MDNLFFRESGMGKPSDWTLNSSGGVGMKSRAAKVAVLAVLSFTAALTVILDPLPSESDEPHQLLPSEAERYASEVIPLRITAKFQIARAVIAGRLSLRQAAALFGTLNQVSPELVDLPWRVCFPADTDEQRLCRQVFQYARSELAEAPKRREAVMARLEADSKEELCKEGTNRRPNSLVLVPVEKLLAQAQVELTNGWSRDPPIDVPSTR
jgi:hypothetical protein